MSDANGQAVAYTYFRKDENEARQARVLTWDGARRRLEGWSAIRDRTISCVAAARQKATESRSAAGLADPEERMMRESRQA